jgi:hypothetical protein
MKCLSLCPSWKPIVILFCCALLFFTMSAVFCAQDPAPLTEAVAGTSLADRSDLLLLDDNLTHKTTQLFSVISSFERASTARGMGIRTILSTPQSATITHRPLLSSDSFNFLLPTKLLPSDLLDAPFSLVAADQDETIAPQADVTQTNTTDIPSPEDRSALEHIAYANEVLLPRRDAGPVRALLEPLLALSLSPDVQAQVYESIGYAELVLASQSAEQNDHRDATAQSHFSVARAEFLKMINIVGVSERWQVSGKERSGYTLWMMADTAGASLEFEALIRSHPKYSEYCAEALFHLAEILTRQGRTADALAAYQGIITNYPTTSWQAVATSCLTDCQNISAKLGGGQ